MPEDKPVHVPREKYPELTYPATIMPSVGGDYGEHESVHLMDYWRVIIARRWTILAVLATIVTITMIYTFKQTPMYEATASIQIDKENPNVLSFKDVYQIETGTDDTLRTQFEVLKARTLARKVIEDLKLDRNEEFQPKEANVLASMIAYL